MGSLICPVCGGELERTQHSWLCPKGHCYDLARQGYVNLLQSNQSRRKRHGDDRAMVQARTAFLEKGYYLPALAAVTDAVQRWAKDSCTVLDAGCGEGWYTAHIADTLREAGKNPCVIGVDISKAALAAAGRRGAGLMLAVASSAHLPIADSSCQLVLDLFAPLECGEFGRALAPDGVLIRVLPLKEHLMELKEAVYDRPRPNDPPVMELPGFALEETQDVRGLIRLHTTEEIQALFMMTPYYYKTGATDQAKLNALTELETELAVRVAVYRKA